MVCCRWVKEKSGGSGKGRKWRLWRSLSGDLKVYRSREAYDGSDSSSVVAEAFNAAVATVVRAPPKDFKAVRQEWAAIRIQTAFRGFLVQFLVQKTRFFLFVILFLRISLSFTSCSSSFDGKVANFDGFCEGNHGGVVDVGVGFVGEEGVEGSERDSEASSHC